MKNLLFILALTLIFACGKSENTNTNTSSNTSSASANLEGFDSAPIPGVAGMERVSKKNGVGRMIEEGTLLNGKKHGAWIVYDDVKQTITEIINYHEGKRVGLSIKPLFARVAESSYYANDQLHGPKESYGSSAKVVSQANYIDGKIEGKVVKYYDDGKTLKEESHYKNGLMHGTSKYFGENGELKLEYNYKDGKLLK